MIVDSAIFNHLFTVTAMLIKRNTITLGLALLFSQAANANLLPLSSALNVNNAPALGFAAGDRDGDGKSDTQDNCPDTPNPGQWDKDNDNVGNECDFDIDGDNHSNVIELAAGTKVWDASSFPGSTSVGSDLDNDGINDDLDNCPGTHNPGQWDRDQDKIGNDCDNDIDGDTFSNAQETLAGTNMWDAKSFPREATTNDRDGDGITNTLDNCPDLANQGQWDRDQDNIGNECDNDIDGDNFTNEEELAANTNPWNKDDLPSVNDITDRDSDGKADTIDNCPDVPNQGQWDKDGDGIGNECDPDIDGDTFSNIDEIAAGTGVWNPESFPIDKIADIDNDGIADSVDNCLTIANAKQADLDNDTIGDLCDDDIDGDGFSNNEELIAGTLINDATSFPVVDDMDKDGIADAEDNCPQISNASQQNTDLDDFGDSCDDDIDGDGFANTAEQLAGSDPLDPLSIPKTDGIEYTSEEKSAVATHFEAFGQPYGGCGVPQGMLETQHFVALNVYDAPNNYHDFWSRPLVGADVQHMGEFDNGRNCGRWVEVTLSDDCNGMNDGAEDEEFCRKGEWQTDDSGWFEDKYNGAKLMMLIADSCGDGNGWCRDSRDHLDLATESLNQFVKNGEEIGDVLPLHWNNRKITWKYAKAPNYSGDVKIHFLQGAGKWWPTIMVNHLENGIHGVEQLVDGEWVAATMNSDLGQSYILPKAAATSYQIRILDVEDEYINNGRQYVFELPESCGEKCTAPATETEYTTID